MTDSTPATAAAEAPAPAMREVNYEHSRDFVGILQQLGVSLLVSTYQAGKLVALGSSRDKLALSFHNFEQAMGVAVHPRQLAVGARNQIWFLRSAPAIAPQVEPVGQRDACFLVRSSHVTDEIHGHEMAWSGDELWVVNTRFSCLCTLHEDFSFVPRWRPPFIRGLAAEDRCHLNGLALEAGQPRYVTAMSETDTPAGWRPVKATAGCLIDVASGETVARGLAMPHSPRVHGGRVWLLDSGRGRLVAVDPASGRVESISQQPGYTRGLAFFGPYAFVGLSRIRETATFGGVPIAEHRDQLKCAVAVVDLRTGRRAAYFEFLSGVEEIFDVQVLPGIRYPFISGPMAAADGTANVWLAPKPGEAPPTAMASSAVPATASQPDVAAPTPRPQPASGPVPDEALVHYNRGNERVDQNRLDEAVACFEAAVRVAPQFAAAHCNRGVALQFLGRLDESVTSFRRALECHPEMPAAHFNLAMSLFLQGDFERAWSEYEWRWKCQAFGTRPAAAIKIAPVWDGSSLAGRSILVYGEQGIGDEIMFASCLPDIISQAGRSIVATEARLVPLLRRSFPEAEVLAIEQLQDAGRRAQLGGIDVQVAAGSAPRFLRPRADRFPQRDHYLVADADAHSRWQARLAELGPGLKVGISWRGGKGADEIRRRSTTLAQWQPLFAVPDVHFVNLQYGDCSAELREAREQLGVRIHHWPDVDPLADMDYFAAQIAALNLVVAIDNSTVHLAGSLGVPTWMLLGFPSSSCWRWLMNGDDTLWYRSVRLFRKPSDGNWEDVIHCVADALRNSFPHRSE